MLVDTDAVRYKVYCDQILDGTNKQDALAVSSMLEAFLRQLHKELPFIESGTLQSDNARCYQAHELLLLIPLISALSPVSVSRFIHTETQDGKGFIDAHFARGTSHIEKFMKSSQRNKIRKIATPKGLSVALAWGGGIQNSFVQLVTLDRTRLAVPRKRLLKVCAEAKLYFSRCNDCFFKETGDRFITEDVICEDIAEPNHRKIGYNLRAFSYSAFGDGVEFKVSLNSQSFIPVQCDATNELKAISGVTSTEDVPIMDDHQECDQDDLQNDFIMESGGTGECETSMAGHEQIIRDEFETGTETVVVGDGNENDSHDNFDFDGSISHNAPECYAPYGPPCGQEFSSMLTGTVITKRSRLGSVLGPRDRTRATRESTR